MQPEEFCRFSAEMLSDFTERSEKVSFWLWGAAFAFLGGVGVGTVNFLLSRQVLCKKAEWFSFISIARQILQVGYLVLLFFVAPYTPWGQLPLLAGGVLGLTGAMFFFTWRLMKLNDSRRQVPAPPHEDGREEE